MEYAFSPGLIIEPAAYRNGLRPKGGLSKVDVAWIVEPYPVAKSKIVTPTLEVGLSQNWRSRRDNSNQGHDFGTALPIQDKASLLENLTTR